MANKIVNLGTKTSNRLVEECQLHLISGHTFSSKNLELYNQAYNYWHDFWQKFFDENGISAKVQSDDFTRQDMIVIFTHKNEIVSMHLYNLFDLNLKSSLHHSYFGRTFNSQFIKYLEDKKTQSVMSLEYLTVNPNWRKSLTGISFAKLHINLAAKIQKLLNIDAGIGISRRDLKVTQMVQEIGWTLVVPEVKMHGKDCDLMAGFKSDLTDHPDSEIQKLTEHFWKSRIDLTGLTQTTTRQPAKAS